MNGSLLRAADFVNAFSRDVAVGARHPRAAGRRLATCARRFRRHRRLDAQEQGERQNHDRRDPPGCPRRNRNHINSHFWIVTHNSTHDMSLHVDSPETVLVHDTAPFSPSPIRQAGRAQSPFAPNHSNGAPPTRDRPAPRSQPSSRPDRPHGRLVHRATRYHRSMASEGVVRKPVFTAEVAALRPKVFRLLAKKRSTDRQQ